MAPYGGGHFLHITRFCDKFLFCKTNVYPQSGTPIMYLGIWDIQVDEGGKQVGMHYAVSYSQFCYYLAL